MNIDIDYLNGVDIIYWINLDRAKDRQLHMKNIFKDDIFKNKKIVRVKAVDYKNTDLTKMIKTTAVRMKEAEYACLLSHLETINKFSKTDYENALIFEDDISLDYKKYWVNSIKDIIDGAPKDWDIIKLYIKNSMQHNNLYTLWSQDNITIGYDTNKNLKTMGHDSGTIAYLINNKAAKKLTKQLYHNKKYILDDCIPIHVADYFIYTLLKTYVYKYPFFCFRKNNKSYVQKYKNNIKYKNKTKKLLIKQEKFLQSHKNKSLKKR